MPFVNDSLSEDAHPRSNNRRPRPTSIASTIVSTRCCPAFLSQIRYHKTSSSSAVVMVGRVHRQSLSPERSRNINAPRSSSQRKYMRSGEICHQKTMRTTLRRPRDGGLNRDTRSPSRAEVISPPEQAARRNSPISSRREACDFVNRGLQRGASTGRERIERFATAGYAVDIGSEDSDEISEILVQFSPRTVGKIERLTGNALSNDFYSDRASGTSRRSVKGDPRPHSYPRPAMPKKIASLPLQLETRLSTETESNGASPSAETSRLPYHALSPPPLPLSMKYSSIVPLARQNSGDSTTQQSPKRVSFTYTDSDLVVTQYSRAKQLKKSSSTGVLVPPPSAAFGSFGENRRKYSTATTTTSSGISPTSPTPLQRISWSGRSILILDSPPVSKSASPQIPEKPEVTSFLNPDTPPKFATSPFIRTSAFGPHLSPGPIPPLPPPPPPPLFRQDSGDAASLSLTRTLSDSKGSVDSVSSSISSFNATSGNGPIPIIGGLSPPPAPRPLLSHPPPPVPLKDSRRDLKRTSEFSGCSSIMSDGSTILTDNSDVCLTEIELEMEMSRIRERARRISTERKASRRREEMEWIEQEARKGKGKGKQRDGFSESSGGGGGDGAVGYIFF